MIPVNMITEIQKYRAQFFQILGFTIMAPFGKMVMDVFDMQFVKLKPIFFVLLVISAIIAFGGIMLIVKGAEHLEKIK